MGISQATELRRLRQLENENSKLKKMVAELSLDKRMLQDAIKKKLKASAKAGAGPELEYGVPISVPKSCLVMMTHASMFYYKHRRREDRPLHHRILEIAQTRSKVRI
jgi:putative transposase